MYFYFIIALQGYCIYHCYTHKREYYWILAVIFLPLVGSLIYLFMNVIQKQDIDKVQHGVTTLLNPTKKISDLEKRLKFADTFQNRVALADAYLEAEHYEKAIEHYKTALSDVFKHDFYVISKLQEAYYFSSDFDTSLVYAEQLKEQPKFAKSKAAFLYALAKEKKGDIETATKYLKTFNAPYSRYQERLELAKFYIRNSKLADAREILEEIVTEAEGMSKQSYQQNKLLIAKAKELLKTGL